MPEIKRIFSSGRMNKDLDERLVPNGEYRDAMNIRVTSDSDGNSGALQNINGNVAIPGMPTLTNPIIKGSCRSTSNDAIYWFVKATEGVYLFEYANGSLTTVIHDSNNSVFNFDNNLITGITYFEGFIAITDNINEPKLIDIDYYKTNGYSGLTERDITVIKQKPSSAPTLTFDNTPTGEDVPYETKFIRFAYRWKFIDGQYSCFSPFSNTAFNPATFSVDPKEGYNLGMVNTATSVTLSNIYLDVTGLNNYNKIESVDILAKFSDNNTVYVVETIPATDIDNTSSLYEYELTSEQIYSVVPSDQILRHWDAVPLKALAQEFVSNRVIYGNYEIGEDTNGIKPDFSVSLSNRGTDRRHIKTNRTYQLGVVFEDEYGRQTPVITNKSGSFNIPFGDSTYLTNPQKLTVQMQDTLPSNNFSRFKYYIKDTSGDYYNVFVEAVFPDPENPTGSEVWLAVPSTEINKFDEGDFLYLKKGQNSLLPIANSEAKFKALAVESSAPDFIGTDYSADTSVTNVTNFDYLNYNTKGRFFVRLEDKNNVLSDLYVANGPTASMETINSGDFISYSAYPSGMYLGKFRIIDSGGQYYDTSYYFLYDSTSAGGIVRETVGPTYYGGSGSSTGYPEGTLITTDIDLDGDTTTDVDGTNSAYHWYKIDTQYTGYPDGISRDIYVRWGSNELSVTRIIAYPPSNDVEVLDPAVFETVPDAQYLDIYYETEESWPIAQYGTSHDLSYFNCFNFQNGVESNRIRDDYNAPVMDKQVRVSTPIAEQYMRHRNTSGLIWSDIFNARTDVNKLNQFSAAQPITKDLSPEYGSIQLLHTRDTDLVSFCEDKVLRILASKDALYNADGSTNVALSSNVLGQAVPYAGEFGISKNPESFASYGYRAYFTDKSRTAVLRLSMDGLEVISMRGMQRYFDTELKNNSFILGSYDEEYDEYNVTFQTESVSFREANDGWVSRKSFIPESALSLNGTYYTFKDGQLWEHSDTAYKNTFYYTGAGVPSANDIDDSTVTFIYNEEPSTIKNFYTLGYEGDEGWEFNFANTDITTTSTVPGFVEKEGKFFGYLRSTDNAIVDLKQASVKGLGTRS